MLAGLVTGSLAGGRARPSPGDSGSSRRPSPLRARVVEPRVSPHARAGRRVVACCNAIPPRGATCSRRRWSSAGGSRAISRECESDPIRASTRDPADSLGPTTHPPRTRTRAGPPLDHPQAHFFLFPASNPNAIYGVPAPSGPSVPGPLEGRFRTVAPQLGPFLTASQPVARLCAVRRLRVPLRLRAAPLRVPLLSPSPEKGVPPARVPHRVLADRITYSYSAGMIGRLLY